MKTPRVLVAVALLVLAACGGDSDYSPTAPTPSPSPPPTGSLAGGFSLGFNWLPPHPGNPEGQILLDGVALYSGPLLTCSPWDTGGCAPRHSSAWTEISPGRHTLSVRVTRQGISPASYSVSGEIWSYQRQAAAWNEEVTLATGDAWTVDFEVYAGDPWDY
jgi:hypothetical protein